MKLLENVRGEKTSQFAIATAMAFGKKVKKVPILVKTCQGFLVNRAFFGKIGHHALLAKGVSPAAIDKAAEEFGMKMGPFRMGDLVGIDLFGRERERNGQADPQKVIADALYAAGRYGQKVGKGFYAYDEKRKPVADPAADAIISEVWKNTGVTPKTLSSEEIVEALYFPTVNECFNCLDEGIVARASDIDVGIVHGAGFPRYRGGPMQWASQVGFKNILEGVQKLGIEPSALLKEAAENGWNLRSKAFTKRVPGMPSLPPVPAVSKL
eukprot:NODE_13166_length_1181_cov_4.898482.p1 GENE.NODE_13166_length_1181_cov_4.898482~~NODE_13166_length_1181_cov_4.898482.p1  ORF type:complete len:314 (+),score=105.82 NODE_13166_length_1181_cov_4.898482:139-942(+)